MAEHVPVLLDRVVDLLAPRPGALIVDATLGLGGHAVALAERIRPGGRLVGIDRDPQALEIARGHLAGFGDAFLALHGRHERLVELLDGAGIGPVDGILLDLGVSSMQLDDVRRGFSFRQDGPLDMRMDSGAAGDAADLVAGADETELTRILREFGEERRARAIARAIVRERAVEPILTTARLADIVRRALGPAALRFRIDPATRSFQALRIAVNGEIAGLERLVEDATGCLRPGGRLVVIAYHSLEDRAIKHSMRALAHRCTCPPDLPVCGCGRQDLLRVLTTRPVRPDDDEIRRNPRARSARLRAAERR